MYINNTISLNIQLKSLILKIYSMVGGVMTVEFGLDTILHQRIIDKCMPLYKDGHFSSAAFESMKQVELALKEKSGTGKNHCLVQN